MYEIKCSKCGEVNQVNDLMRDRAVKCFVCGAVIQKDTIKEEKDDDIKTEEMMYPVGNDFYCKKGLWIRSNGEYYQVSGEIRNKSNRNYDFVTFNISAHNKKGEFIGKGDIIIQNFLEGQTRAYDAVIVMAPISNDDMGDFIITYESSSNDCSLFNFLFGVSVIGALTLWLF